jgi:hypothetical protein
MVKITIFLICLFYLFITPSRATSTDANNSSIVESSYYETNTTKIKNGDQLNVTVYLKDSNGKNVTNRRLKMSIGDHREYEGVTDFDSEIEFNFTIYNLSPGEYPVVFTDITRGEPIEIKSRFTLEVQPDLNPSILPCFSKLMHFI